MGANNTSPDDSIAYQSYAVLGVVERAPNSDCWPEQGEDQGITSGSHLYGTHTITRHLMHLLDIHNLLYEFTSVFRYLCIYKKKYVIFQCYKIKVIPQEFTMRRNFCKWPFRRNSCDFWILYPYIEDICTQKCVLALIFALFPIAKFTKLKDL